MYRENEELARNWSIISMTGMGHAKVDDNDLGIDCSLKSLNQKGLDIKYRLNSELSYLEPLIGSLITKKLGRGRIDVEISLSFKNTDSEISLDIKKAKALVAGLNDFYGTLDEEMVLPLSMGDLLSLPGVLTQTEKTISKPQLEVLTMKVLAMALEDLLHSRLKDGQAVAESLRKMLNKSQNFIKEIQVYKDQDVEIRFQKLKTRCDELFSSYSVNLERIYQESALLAERSDFTEELDRLIAHVNYFKTTCELLEPKGRKLDFLCQEMLRESNTLLSKAFDHRVSIIGLELKAEIEKIREQVQNIE